MLTWKAHEGLVTALAFAPDGARLVTAGAGGLRAWATDAAALWSVPLPDGAEPARAVAFTPDGQFVAAGERGGVQLREAASGADVRLLAPPYLDPHDAVTGVFAHPDGVRAYGCIAAESENAVHGWDLRDGQLNFESRCSPGEGGFLGMAGSPDGKLLAVVHYCGLSVIDLASEDVIAEYPGGCEWGMRISLAFAPDGSALAFAADGHLVVWRLDGMMAMAKRAKKKLGLFYEAEEYDGMTRDDRPARVAGATFAGDGRTLLVAEGPLVRFLDRDTLDEQKALDWKAGPLTRLAVSPDGARAACGSESGAVVVWDME